MALPKRNRPFSIRPAPASCATIVDVAAQKRGAMGGGTGGSISGRNNDPSGCQNTSGTATEGAVDATAGTAEGSIGNFFQ